MKKDGTGALDMIESEGDYVLGVVYEVEEDAIGAIDKREGHPRCYERRDIKVTLINKETKVFTYFVVDKKLEEVCPSEEYFEKCIIGMRMWLSEKYVNNFFISHVNEKFKKDYKLLFDEVKHITVADIVKDMTPEQLVSFQRSRYEKFIKPMMNSKVAALDNYNKDVVKNKLQ